MKNLSQLILILLLCSISNVFATTYYVKPTGSDGADGRSHASAWKSVSKINSYSFSKGDDVLFLAGGTWSGTILKIDWDGTSSNRAVVGSYYLNNGSETIGVPNNTSRPIIRGTYDQKGKTIDASDAVPRNRYNGLVRIDGDYVTVQNISIKYSAGEGLDILNAKSGRADHHHAIVENIEIYYTGLSCTTLERGTSHNIIRNNEFHGCDWGWKNKDLKKTAGWPACNIAASSDYNLYENNYIHECFGEGIAIMESNNNLVRSNKLVAIRSASIYADNGKNNVFEHNIVVGQPSYPNTFFNASTPGYSGGISISVEDYNNPQPEAYTGNIVRNNLLVYVKACLSMGLEQESLNAGATLGVAYYGNTCIAPYNRAINVNAPAENLDKVVIRNNVLGFPVGNPIEICRAPTTTKVVFSNNSWENRPSDNDCNGVGDVYGKTHFTKSDWSTVGVANIPDAADFTPLAGQPGKNGAMSLTSDIITTSSFPLYSESTAACSPLDTKGLTYDFNCKRRSGNSDIGAIDMSDITTLPPVLLVPQGLSLTIVSSPN